MHLDRLVDDLLDSHFPERKAHWLRGYGHRREPRWTGQGAHCSGPGCRGAGLAIRNAAVGSGNRRPVNL